MRLRIIDLKVGAGTWCYLTTSWRYPWLAYIQKPSQAHIWVLVWNKPVRRLANTSIGTVTIIFTPPYTMYFTKPTNNRLGGTRNQQWSIKANDHSSANMVASFITKLEANECINMILVMANTQCIMPQPLVEPNTSLKKANKEEIQKSLVTE